MLDNITRPAVEAFTMQTSTEKSKEARTIAMIVAHKAYRNAQFGESRERASPRGEICLVITSKLLREMEFVGRKAEKSGGRDN